MKSLQMSGLYPATVTPFRSDLSIDKAALERHISEVAKPQGVSGVVVNGGIGELLTLKVSEQAEIVRLARRVVRPGQTVIAGIEARLADDAVAAASAVKAAGAEALLVLPPFDIRAYRKLSTDIPSVLAYFQRLDQEVGLPIVIFQYPQHTGCSYTIEVLQALAELDSLVAIKVAAESFSIYLPVWETLRDKLAILAASDSPPLFEMLAHGAHGAMIGISTIETPIWTEILVHTNRGEPVPAHLKSAALHIMDGVFENQKRQGLIGDPAATKEALFQLGRIPSSRVRPPAKTANDSDKRKIRQGLQGARLLVADAAAS